MFFSIITVVLINIALLEPIPCQTKMLICVQVTQRGILRDKPRRLGCLILVPTCDIQNVFHRHLGAIEDP